MGENGKNEKLCGSSPGRMGVGACAGVGYVLKTGPASRR